jgi:hypothetical protein
MQPMQPMPNGYYIDTPLNNACDIPEDEMLRDGAIRLMKQGDVGAALLAVKMIRNAWLRTETEYFIKEKAPYYSQNHIN